MRADRHIERQLAGADADLGLEPLAVFRDQIDDRDRRVERARRQPGDIVVIGLGRGIEDGVAGQGRQPVARLP